MAADVTWTGPAQRAEKLLAKASEHLEFGRTAQARICLMAMARETRALLDCIEEKEVRDVQLAAAQARHVADHVLEL